MFNFSGGWWHTSWQQLAAHFSLWCPKQSEQVIKALHRPAYSKPGEALADPIGLPQASSPRASHEPVNYLGLVQATFRQNKGHQLVHNLVVVITVGSLHIHQA